MCSQEMMELTLASHCSQSLGGNCRLCRIFPESSAVGAAGRPRRAPPSEAWLVLSSLAELSTRPREDELARTDSRASGLHMHGRTTTQHAHITSSGALRTQPGVLFCGGGMGGRSAEGSVFAIREPQLGPAALGGGVVNGAVRGGGGSSSSVSCVSAICRAIRAWICSGVMFSGFSLRPSSSSEISSRPYIESSESFSRLLDGFTSSAACDGDRRVRKARQPRQRDGIAGRRGGGLRVARLRRRLGAALRLRASALAGSAGGVGAIEFLLSQTPARTESAQ